MLKFEIETEDADWLVGVYIHDCRIGEIYQSIFTGDYVFVSSKCGCNADEIILIANKMKELENARTKTD